MYPGVWYIEEIVLLFYVGECLIFSPSMDKTDTFYVSLKTYLKIEDDVEPINILA